MEPQPIETAGSRRDFYGFLARAYLKEPSEDMVGGLCDLGLLADLEESFGKETVLPLRRFQPSFDGDCKKVRLDFHALFKAPVKRYVAPYESVHVDGRKVDGREEDGLLMGPSHRQVLSFYKKAGFSLSPESGELADYIGNELEFLSRLCDEEVQACSKGDEELARRCRAVQLEFLEQHLGKWVQSLAERTRRKAITGLYKGIARLTSAFVLGDMEALRESRQAHAASS